jgi:hypothetical protein
MSVTLDIVNTVNTRLNNEYDFGIHKCGCADVGRAEARYGCEVYHGLTAESVEAYIAEDEADWAAQEQEGFIYRVFPCTRK